MRADLGDSARIVAANRVRRGGLGGFFSREHYEVIVDQTEKAAQPIVVDLRDEPAERDLTAAATGGALSVLDLVDAVNGSERARETRRATASIAEPVDDGAVAPVSTETERFVQILDRIARDVEARDAQVASSEPIAEIDVREPGVAPSPAPAERDVAHERADRARRAARAARAKAEPGVSAEDHVEIVTEARTMQSLAPSVTPFLPPRVRRGRDLDVIERPENLLARLGLPARFVPRGVVGAQLRPALIEALAQLPVAAPLPSANGVVIAVIGVGAQPVVLARALAADRGLDPDNLVLATERELGDGIPSWLQITDPGTAEERRRSWRRRDHATLVAVSVPSVTTSSQWARSMLDRLEPTQTWGIVNAAWKPEDVEAWSERLGGFDVLALEHVADTVSPAAAIQVDIPIARIDGMPATPLRWAEILTERLVQS